MGPRVDELVQTLPLMLKVEMFTKILLVSCIKLYNYIGIQ